MRAILPILPIAFLTGYRVIAFLCWVPSLLVAQLLLRRGPRAPSLSATPSATGASAYGCVFKMVLR